MMVPARTSSIAAAAAAPSSDRSSAPDPRRPLREQVRDLRGSSWWPGVRQGIIGGLLITAGSAGSASIVRQDHRLRTSALGWIQYGHGSLLSTLILWAGVLLLLVGWLRIGRRLLANRDHCGRPAPRDAGTAGVLTTVAWTLPLLPSMPLFSRDVYSYLAQGMLARDGYNPFIEGVIALVDNPIYLQVSSQWRNTTTPYGPLHVGLQQTITTIFGDTIVPGIIANRLISAVAMIAVAFAVVALARALQRPAGPAVWAATMNPLALVHLVGGMHNEVIMLVFMLSGLTLVVRCRPLLGIALITVGAAVKATAAVALPFAVWMWIAHRREKRGGDATRPAPWHREVLELLRTGVPGAIVAMGVFAAITLVTRTDLSWISALAGSGKVINWLTLPTAVTHIIFLFMDPDTGLAFPVILAIARTISSVLMGATILAAWLFFRRGPLDAIRGILVAFAAMVLLNSLALPWYYTWITALLGLLPLGRRAWAWCAGLSTWLVLIVGPDGGISLYTPVWVLLAVLAGLAAGTFLLRGPSLFRRSHWQARRRVSAHWWRRRKSTQLAGETARKCTGGNPTP